MSRIVKGLHFTLLLLLIAGCGANNPYTVKQVSEDVEADMAEMLSDVGESNERFSGAEMREGPYVGIEVSTADELAKKNENFLADKNITLKVSKPINGEELMKLLRGKGLSMVSNMKLGDYTYSGYGVEDVSAETALQVFLGSMGLDYSIDYVNRIIEVKPLRWQTWYVSIGQRNTTYRAGDDSEDDSSSSGTKETESVAESLVSDMAGSAKSTSESDFWGSLGEEIEQRMTILVPKKRAMKADMTFSEWMKKNGMDMPGENRGDSENYRAQFMEQMSEEEDSEDEEMFSEVLMGRFAINADTGAISVQAPHWLTSDIGEYIERINAQFNTVITFEGRLYMVTTDQEHSSGLDFRYIEDFMKDHYKYNIAFANNALGGVTINTNDIVSDLSTGPQGVADTLIGIASGDQTFQLLNAFLSQHGKVSVVQKPILSTTSGMPANFSKATTTYYNTVSQNAAAADGGAVVGTTNTLVPVEIGTNLRVYPIYDASRGLVHAQITLNQKLQSGTLNTTQMLSSANGNVSQVNVQIPLITQSKYDGETLLRDGDVILVGGQTESSANINNSGLPWLKDQAGVSAIAGNKREQSQVSTFYFALSVKVERKG